MVFSNTGSFMGLMVKSCSASGIVKRVFSVSAGFAITVPRSYRNGYGTIDEVQANQIAMSRFSMMMF